MPAGDVERRLPEVGAVFIEAHDRAAAVIREAAQAGMSPETISRISGLSPETVAAFLRSASS